MSQPLTPPLILEKTNHYLNIIQEKFNANHFGTRQVDQLITHIVDTLLLYTVVSDASDLHCEPVQSGLRIRVRLFGVLQSIIVFPDYLTNRIINCIKIMANLDISQSLIPQDGRISWKYADLPCVHEFRVSTCPTQSGEKAVLRLLKQQALLSISHLGMSDSQHTLYESCINAKQGLILITGPTGSGKTTSLYAGINQINNESINILTIEDPVEIKLDGINQVSVNPKAGLNFSTTLRSFLRQDPDVIMIGEIRNKETAEIALKAAQTGHLVFASLHTNTALGAISRLENMGIAKHLIIDGLKLIIAQRMVRKLCQHCQNSNAPATINCEYCDGGFHGQTAIFELLEIDKTLNQMIANSTTLAEMESYLEKQQHITLKASANHYADQGLISSEDLLRLGLT